MNIKTSNDALNRLSVAAFKNSEKAPLHIVLDNIRSAQNVGSIFRTMDAFRCAKLYLCGITATPPHREIQKTALGATETLVWEYYRSTIDALAEIGRQDMSIFAVEQTNNSTALQDFKPDFTKPTAFIFGNEVNGVDQKLVNLANGSIEIPQYGSKHSLNIAVCAGILIWHYASGFSYRAE